MTETTTTSLLADEIATIAGGLTGPALATLGPRIAAARIVFPGDLRLRLLEGEWHERSGLLAEAEGLYRAAWETHPGNAWPGVRLAGLLLGTSQVAKARALFADRLWTSALPESQRTGLLSRLLAATPDLPEREAFLACLLSGTPDDRFVLLKLAALCIRRRDRAGAVRLFQEATRLGPLPMESELLALDLELAAGRFEEAFVLAESLHRRYPDRVDLARRVIHAAHLANRRVELPTLVEHAIARWPQDWLILFRYNRAACPADLDRAAFSRLERHAQPMAEDDRWMFQFAIACLRHDQTARAMAVLERLGPESPVAPMALPLRTALASRPAAAWRSTRGVRNEVEADAQVVRTEGACATVVVLAGVQGGLGYLPFSHVDPLLAGHRVNAIYLRDTGNRAFTCGVRSIALDEAGTLAWLRETASRLGGAPMVTMGASLGGMAAVRMATRLPCRAAISFAGPLQLGARDPDAEAGEAESTRFAMTASLLHDEASVPELVRAAPETRVFQCYAEDYPPDAATAALLRDCPNAVLVAVPGHADHFVVEHMIANGAFHEVLLRAIGTAP